MEGKLQKVAKQIREILHENPGQEGLLFNQVMEYLFQDDELQLAGIEAQEITVVVTDQCSGRTIFRRLPLQYGENANGVTITGETYGGTPVQIALLSQFAVEKMRELQGLGPNRPRCNHEESVKSDKNANCSK